MYSSTLNNFWYRHVFKRPFDLIICFLALPFLIPLFILISILIKMDSSGPIFYKGKRAGLNGNPFGIIKFRTMCLNADQGEGTTGLNDPRVTKIGHYLRYYKLDELPQIFNIIVGDMSFVGPRPELLKYTENFNQKESIILSVKPGITDYSSILFSALDKEVGSIDPEKTFEENILPVKNALRIKYIHEQSFIVDLKIICKTIFIILSRVFSKFK